MFKVNFGLGLKRIIFCNRLHAFIVFFIISVSVFMKFPPLSLTTGHLCLFSFIYFELSAFRRLFWSLDQCTDCLALNCRDKVGWGATQRPVSFTCWSELFGALGEGAATG